MIISQKRKRCFIISMSFFYQLLLTHHCFSQNQQTLDSLITKLNQAKEDTNKTKTLQALSSCLFASEPYKSFGYAKQELTLSKKLNYKRGVINAYLRVVDFYYNTKNLD